MEGRKLRCRVGDRAIVIGGDVENLGRVVRVVDRANNFERFFGYDWRIEADHGQVMTTDGWRVSGVSPDDILMPIRPDESPESIVTDEPVEVAA